MAKKKEEAEETGNMEMLSSRQEVADELKITLKKLYQLLQRYPFEKSGAPPKIMGRWLVSKSDVWAWFQYVQRQEIRHPEARRMRPEEPPELASIKGRS